MNNIRSQFPNLNIRIGDQPLIYLDNAATTFKPESVIQAVCEHYRSSNANIHRGIHTLSQQTTKKYEEVRAKTCALLHASTPDEIIFTSGTTDAVNLVAYGLGKNYFRQGDEIVVTQMEHHSNFVPWQILAKEMRLKLKIAPVQDDGTLDMKSLEDMVGVKTRLVCVTHASNVLGTVNPIQKITALSHLHDALVLVDGAQSVGHRPVNVKEMDCDFFAFSAHKMFGPTGVGVLYGKKNLLNDLTPFKTGGEMVENVAPDAVTFNAPPLKFEAGTPPIAGVMGLGAAIDFLHEIGFKNICATECDLLNHAANEISKIEGLTCIGNAPNKVPLISFHLDGIHPHDAATILDAEGVAIRSGNLCAQPICNRFGYNGLCRVSLCFYNTFDEIDTCVAAIRKAKGILT